MKFLQQSEVIELDLLKEIELGNFRMDLFHRLSVILIHVPPLHERRSDIPILAENFCADICADYNMPVKKITDDAMSTLMSLPWTGNIRELRNMIERLIILSEKTITKKDVIAYANPGENSFDHYASHQEYLDQMSRFYILYKLDKNAWNISLTAKEMDVKENELEIKINKLGLKREH